MCDLWVVLEEFGVEKHQINRIQIIYENSNACERMERTVGEYNERRWGLRQGVLSHLSCLIYLCIWLGNN